ncbi:NACHT, LRR and PYD domains-containing protein 3-like isoform X2 [Hemitrygon akajei]|uniref:NACHT, LRR and PYD domains-containing protein 3-like isoform X2 n=1 Tax=Hemitrygon akajei TaxID=2704970 RepID=UPI003BF99B04
MSAALRNPECKIQRLWIDRNGLTDSCAGNLASALSTNRSLTELYLRRNNLGDSGVKLMSAPLREPECKIQRLWLGENSLTESCATDLGDALSKNDSLMMLELGRNELRDLGVKLVSASLSSPDCKLKQLWLRDVGLTDSCIEDLVSALMTNPSLNDLDLGSNSLTDRSVPDLQRLILEHPSLQQFGLRNNPFSSDRENQLKSLQEERPGLRVDL